MTFLSQLRSKSERKQKSLAVLIDPDNISAEHLVRLIRIAVESGVDYFFVGGSLLIKDQLDEVLTIIKDNSTIPAIIFPGNNIQVSAKADGILFLSLISGRNPEFLIGQHVIAAPYLKSTGIEVVPTGYILIDGGNKTAVSYMSHTEPIPSDKPSIAACTALAGEMLGLGLIYLEAGSGALTPVNSKMIASVRKSVKTPIVVGGGIRSVKQLQLTLDSGADLVVVGTSVEKDSNLLHDLCKVVKEKNNNLPATS